MGFFRGQSSEQVAQTVQQVRLQSASVIVEEELTSGDLIGLCAYDESRLVTLAFRLHHRFYPHPTQEARRFWQSCRCVNENVSKKSVGLTNVA